MFRFLKKMRARRTQAVEQKISKWNGPLEDQKVSLSLDDNIAISKGLFKDMDIIRYKEVVQNEEKRPLRYFLVFCDGMVNSEIINTHIVKPLMTITPNQKGSLTDALLADVVQIGETKTTDCFKDVVESVTFGDTILFADGCGQAAILNTKQPSLRSIEEPDNEKVLGGPREGFTESLMQNLSQVTRRVHTNEFKTKMLTLGQRTRTSVCVCYFDSLVDKSLLSNLLTRLGHIKIDGVLDSNYITELIRDRRYSPFRSTGYTERPDVIVGKLLEGRIAIFVDGTPMVLTIPHLFIENFQSSEDYYFNFYYTSFARMLRIGAFFLTVAVPALYIATVAFHQEMLPLSLLMRIALERQSVPLPAAIEAVVMLLVFDILRETGARMPSNIGQALSIVGALVIGQAAVEANLVAAPMIIVVAATGITSLVVPKLNAPIIFWRFLLLMMAASFGFFGLTIGLCLLVFHINNLKSFGFDQTSLQGSFRIQAIKDILIRAPWHMMIKRPPDLNMDETRQARGDSDD
ncbi:MAG: spore germination protein [Christensenellales bacterium]|jgi:spore germination protein KA